MSREHGTVSRYTAGCRCGECGLSWLAYWQRVHEERRAAGLCLRCSTPLDDEYLRCFTCRRDAAEAKRRWRARRRAELMGHPAGADLP